ncbi:MAG: bifunctional (p)ppGpp synthetase/guanosine-3',5'-bis(diphosphate) 3'-pyrophosphohydrolase [Paraperlucidibaca sp.]|jgi:guanosine-3',5'-bis(diphosphate) 3'-pyrophosphohydrolase|uniref:RelA/SpoT family protein n=1 Tax=Paraperlucidibaca sp. TaxID=2708021 RepID=UPI001B3E03CF|nr:bifunctional (p)ppGpp synthetase/guanosine-3',5'-bis(diphosphate) 3'-pyrophosphohydrolase [Paraperlucidibaca sp.]MBQ0723019.1 bifunctional (p)ppGpp synthetase/guanosine-3',5'-bis(diphosphate) 3'-pyrophosphohydrolase [Paraperlucidibaca sp.]MBQ0841744.1 bifunctional (p)ppGpp synthetase/guanosine-3',5'-bis(diphosphate) 3'-pyrophosphohydrolase [Paraperlucidibaca sp.]|tara:strand:+ start:14968 stop:17091 length:2124 start_codon:yes stop_codon:yes gene_type:complete
MNSGIDALCTRLSNYLSPEQVAQVHRAYLFSEQAHIGQFRRNGDPYVTHPLAVAHILCDMHMDHHSLMAAMLHDVIEDTGVSKDALAKEFGDEVTALVDGVTKLTQVHFNSKAEAQAENFRKMILAMTHDVRVIVVKLADRLHNMRTLDVLTVEKRKRVARETLDIYAPIAMRLGMNDIRIEYEELGFHAIWPMRAERIEHAVMAARGHRREMVISLEVAISERLAREGIQARVEGREKHLFSIYQKMREKRRSFSEIMDVYGFRVIVESVDSCYRSLGMMHNLYKPIPGKFKDYIAIPKTNGYQSLHTVLKGPRGVPIEVQIRSEAMDAMASNGIAAHWLYKSDSFTNTSQTRAREWMKSLQELQKNAGDSLEFIESVKIDLFPDEVYLFTPKGRIMTLPRGATPVDFAYAVHSDIGDTCVAARVDNRLAPLSLPLTTGQTVEIIAAPGARPNPSWLDFVITSKARAKIRHFLKDQQSDESRDLGLRLLEKSLSGLGKKYAELPADAITNLLKELAMDSADTLLENIGMGNQVPQIIARRLVPDVDVVTSTTLKRTAHNGIAIRGTEGLVVSYARCCRPLPGDDIMGHLSAGRGVVIHRHKCRNMAAEMRSNPDKCVPLRWAEKVDREFICQLRIALVNRRGMLAEIAREATESEASIDNVQIEEKGSHHGVMQLGLVVRDRIHLARVIKRIRVLPGVDKVTRVSS